MRCVPRFLCLWRGAWLAALLFANAVTAAAAAFDAAAIMAKADRMNRPRYEIARLRMEMTGGDTGPQVRELVMHAVNDGGARTSLFKFTAPASLRGVGTLVIEEEGKSNAIWHYVPATRNVRRIAGEHRQNRFMGTEFTFEDFEGLKLSKYAFSGIGTERCREAATCYVVEGRASDPEERAASGYGRKVFWIDRESYAIVKIELFDAAGALLKTFEAQELRQLGEYWRPRRQTMTNVRNGRVTTMIELERTVDEPFDGYYIGQRYLRSDQ